MAEDPAEVVAKMRAGIYRDLYKRSHGVTRYDGDNEFDLPYGTADSGTTGRETKPFIPPTPVTENEALPFGNVVGAPLGF